MDLLLNFRFFERCQFDDFSIFFRGFIDFGFNIVVFGLDFGFNVFVFGLEAGYTVLNLGESI